MIYKNFIFIHIPKTGGSSIRSSLSDNYELIHNASEVNFQQLGYNDSNEKFEKYDFTIHSFKDHLPYQLIARKKYFPKYKFTFIRNPYSRAVSLYYECISAELHQNNLGISKNVSFEDFLSLLIKNQYWFTIPMIDYIGEKNLNYIDDIFKFEDFDDGIYKLKKKIKISIKHHNYNNVAASINKFSDYRSYYSNKENIKKVNFLYKKDLDYFNYDFDKFIRFENKKMNIFTILQRILKRKFSNFFNYNYE